MSSQKEEQPQSPVHISQEPDVEAEKETNSH